jgi:hypothetical protein
MNNYAEVLSCLSTAFTALNQAKELIGEEVKDRLLVLDFLIKKTEEAIYRWKFRHGQE